MKLAKYTDGMEGDGLSWDGIGWNGGAQEGIWLPWIEWNQIQSHLWGVGRSLYGHASTLSLFPLWQEILWQKMASYTILASQPEVITHRVH